MWLDVFLNISTHTKKMVNPPFALVVCGRTPIEHPHTHHNKWRFCHFPSWTVYTISSIISFSPSPRGQCTMSTNLQLYWEQCFLCESLFKKDVVWLIVSKKYCIQCKKEDELIDIALSCSHTWGWLHCHHHLHPQRRQLSYRHRVPWCESFRKSAEGPNISSIRE